MNATEANLLLTQAAAIWPTITPSVQKADMWAEILGGVTLAEATDALKIHAQTTDRPPMPVYIRTIVKQARNDRILRQPERTGLQCSASKQGCPRPRNMAAMERAARDPLAFAAEVAKYHDQLRAEGHAACIRRPGETWHERYAA